MERGSVVNCHSRTGCTVDSSGAPLLRAMLAGWVVMAGGSAAVHAQDDQATRQSEIQFSGGPQPPNLSSVGVNIPVVAYFDLGATRMFTDIFKASGSLGLSVPTDP